MKHAPIKAGIDKCTNVHWFQSVYVSKTKGAAIVITVKAEQARKTKGGTI